MSWECALTRLRPTNHRRAVRIVMPTTGAHSGTGSNAASATERGRPGQHPTSPTKRLPRSDGTVVGGICHDLRSPIDGASRFLRLAQRALAEGRVDKARELLESVDVGLVRIEEIVGSFESFSSQGRFASSLQDVAAVLDECLLVTQERALAAGVVVITDVVRPLPGIEAGNLFQVFCNIIQNAIEAMPAAGRLTIKARVAATADSPFEGVANIHSSAAIDQPREVVVRFEDNGIGLPDQPGNLPFEPFFSTKPGEKSKGLGLAICKEIVEQSGGTITAVPAGHKGTVVTVRLPATED